MNGGYSCIYSYWDYKPTFTSLGGHHLAGKFMELSKQKKPRDVLDGFGLSIRAEIASEICEFVPAGCYP